MDILLILARSEGLIGAAAILTSTSHCFGVGTETVRITNEPPGFSRQTAFMFSGIFIIKFLSKKETPKVLIMFKIWHGASGKGRGAWGMDLHAPCSLPHAFIIDMYLVSLCHYN